MQKLNFTAEKRFSDTTKKWCLLDRKSKLRSKTAYHKNVILGEKKFQIVEYRFI